MNGNRSANPISRYVKWAMALVLPSAGMYFLFTETNINPLLVIVLAVVFCAGLLFMFGLITLPVTKIEKDAMQEESILSMINKSLDRIDQAARTSKNPQLLDEMAQLLSKARTFILLLAGDNLNSIDLAQGVHDHIVTLQTQLTNCNRLASSPEDGIYDLIIESTHAISQSLEVMTTNYRQGQMEEVRTSLTSLGRKLMMQGYIRPQHMREE